MNIFQIKQDLLAIFDELEENGGELTPELEEKLFIKEELLKDSVQNYTDVIKLLQSDIESIKLEQKRLKDLADRKQRTINRIESIIVDAIEKFGNTKKSGVRYLDYSLGEVSIRNSKAVNVDTDVVKEIGKAVGLTAMYMRGINQLDVADRLNPANIIEFVGENTNEISSTSYTVTEDDLNHTNIELSVKVPLTELLNGEAYPIIKEIVNHTTNFDTIASVSKTDIKKDLEQNGSCAPNIAKLVINKSIQIK